jgi:hypothetical protein
LSYEIRIPKIRPDLDRRAARDLAHEIAEADGHQPHELRKAHTRIERVDGAVRWEYVVEFPDAKM